MIATSAPSSVVVHDRYVLFRTTRIFAGMTFVRDGLRLGIHLDGEAPSPMFIKVVRSRDDRVAHVVRICSPDGRA